MINLSLNELKLIAKSRSFKDYKDKIKILSELRYGFSKSKINEFRRRLYNIKKQKILSSSDIIETEKNLFELEKSIYSLKKYYDYDDTE